MVTMPTGQTDKWTEDQYITLPAMDADRVITKWGRLKVNSILTNLVKLYT